MVKQGPTVRKIFVGWLNARPLDHRYYDMIEAVEDFLDDCAGEYDGLCLGDGADGCGCDRDVLMPCNENVADCRARRKRDAKG